jgi:methionyl-tRNA synthetase
MKTCYHTTPIYYVNDVPHVGHAYTTVATDTLTRARRLMGRRVFFVTGTDEHGQNIERIARERGVPEQEHCDRVAAEFKSLWERLDVRYDRFIRTTEDVHVRGVLKLWSRLVSAKTPDGRDAVYRGTYAGLYCSRCEGFKDEEELRQPGNICPDHERPCEWTEEQNYFFRLSAYQGWLAELVESGRMRIEPEGRRNEILAVIRQGLKDFSVSRARVKWGIPVPGEPDHVLYVWVDALSNYLTALGYADDAAPYQEFWEGGDERLHVLGKDIIRFHCLYWPAMLYAAGLPVPTRVFGQGFITKDGRKLSKTTGNVIVPDELVRRLGTDAVRYFLLREGVYGQDWDFTDAAFVGRYNADLANDLGNLVSRALTMAARYCDGRVPRRPPDDWAPATSGAAHALHGDPGRTTQAVLKSYDELDFSDALAEVWHIVGLLNSDIVIHAPWEMAKNAAHRDSLEFFLYELLEAIRLVAVLTSPVMPSAAGRILKMMGRPENPEPSDLAWGRLEPGTAIGAIEPLFPRVETKAGRPTKEVSNVSEEKQDVGPAALAVSAPAPVQSGEPRIDIADFAKIDLRVAQVIAAEPIAGATKLLKLEVDLGDERRQIVAGIAEAYQPESLIGRKIALVANLKAAKLRGVESNGMLLAASHEGRPVLCTFDADVPVGTKIK